MEENQEFHEIKKYYAKLLKALKCFALIKKAEVAAVPGREVGASALVLRETCE